MVFYVIVLDEKHKTQGNYNNSRKVRCTLYTLEISDTCVGLEGMILLKLCRRRNFKQLLTTCKSSVRLRPPLIRSRSSSEGNEERLYLQAKLSHVHEMLELLEKPFKAKVLRFGHYSFLIKADDNVLQHFALIIWQFNFTPGKRRRI